MTGDSLVESAVPNIAILMSMVEALKLEVTNLRNERSTPPPTTEAPGPKAEIKVGYAQLQARWLQQPAEARFTGGEGAQP